MAPFHVRSKVCIAPILVQCKVCQFASHMYGSNADLAPHMERSHTDFAPHMEWRPSFRDQKNTKIAISANFQKKNIKKKNYILGVYMTYVTIFEDQII